MTRYIVVTANSFMQITDFFYSENFSIGAAAGEGLRYRFVVANATGRVEYLEELVDGRMALQDRRRCTWLPLAAVNNGGRGKT